MTELFLRQIMETNSQRKSISLHCWANVFSNCD